MSAGCAGEKSGVRRQASGVRTQDSGTYAVEAVVDGLEFTEHHPDIFLVGGALHEAAELALHRLHLGSRARPAQSVWKRAADALYTHEVEVTGNESVKAGGACNKPARQRTFGGAAGSGEAVPPQFTPRPRVVGCSTRSRQEVKMHAQVNSACSRSPNRLGDNC